jgi:hypothetical protein
MLTKRTDIHFMHILTERPPSPMTTEIGCGDALMLHNRSSSTASLFFD